MGKLGGLLGIHGYFLFQALAVQAMEPCRQKIGIEPDRSNTYHVLSRPHEEFYEYYISGHESACGFRALGYERAEGVKKLLQSLETSKTVQRFVAQSIQADWQKFPSFFGQSWQALKPRYGNLENFSKDFTIQKQYIKKFAIPGRELLFMQMFDGDGKLIEVDSLDKYYNLMDAIAYLCRKSLYIYQIDDQNPHQLHLAHRFNFKTSQETLYLLYYQRPGHFNRLVLRHDQAGCQKALAQERVYLAKDQDILALHSSTQNSYTENQAPEAQRSVDRETVHRIACQFTLIDIARFINQTRGYKHLKGLSIKDSRYHAWDYLTEMINATHKKREKISCEFGRLRLLLEHNYSPQEKEIADWYTYFYFTMKDIIHDYRENKDRELRRFANYSRIFGGKILMEMNRLDKAYKYFLEVEEGYTKVYLLDMAEMIIELGFCVPGKSYSESMTYASYLLDQIKIPTSRSTFKRPRPKGLKKSKEARHVVQKRSQLSHPQYIQRGGNPKRLKLMRDAVESYEDAMEETEEEEESLSSLQEQITPPASPPAPSSPPRRREWIPDLSRLAFEDENSSVEEDDSMTGEDIFPLPQTEETLVENLFLEQNPEREAIRSLILRANYMVGRKSNEERAPLYLRALQQARQIENPILQAQSCLGLGNVRYTDPNHLQNTDWYREALRLSGKKSNVIIRAKAYLGLGNAHYTDLSHPRDTDWYFETLNILRKEDKNLRAQAYLGLGNARYTDLSHPRDADWYLEALNILRKEDKNLRAQAYLGLGKAQYKDRDHPFQSDWYFEVLKILDEDDKRLRAQVYIGLGKTQYKDRDHPLQSDWYFEALKILDEDDKKLRAQAYIGLGNARYKDRDHHRNESFWYLEALKILDEEDKSLRAQAYIGLGNARYKDYDHHRDNTYWYLEVLKILDEDDKKLRAQAYIGLGNARYKDRDHHRNESFWYLEALKILDEEDKSLRAQAYIGLGNARYKDYDHYRDNTYWYLEALKILDEENKSLRSQAYIGLGNARYIDHEHPRDTDWYREALKVLGKNGPQNLIDKAQSGLRRAEQAQQRRNNEKRYHSSHSRGNPGQAKKERHYDERSRQRNVSSSRNTEYPK